MGYNTMTLQSMLDMRLGILVNLICSHSDKKFANLMYTQFIYSHAYCTAGAFACKAPGTETVVRAFIRDVPLRVSSVHLASFDLQLSFRCTERST